MRSAPLIRLLQREGIQDQVQVINFSEALHTRSTWIMHFVSGAFIVGKQERKMTIRTIIHDYKNAVNAHEQTRPLTQVYTKMLFSQSYSVMFYSGDMVCIHLRVPSCASWVSAFTNWGGMTWRHSWRGMRRRAGTATPDSLNCWRGIYKRYECTEEVLQTLPSPPSSLAGPTQRLCLTVWILQPQRFPWQDSPVYLILTPLHLKVLLKLLPGHVMPGFKVAKHKRKPLTSGSTDAMCRCKWQELQWALRQRQIAYLGHGRSKQVAL